MYSRSSARGSLALENVSNDLLRIQPIAYLQPAVIMRRPVQKKYATDVAHGSRASREDESSLLD